jgi:hypothetical protein
LAFIFDDIGATTAFDRCGDPCRHVVLVDHLSRDVDPGCLLELFGLPVDLDVSGGNEAAPLQIVDPAALRIDGRPATQERRGCQRPTGNRGRFD